MIRLIRRTVIDYLHTGDSVKLQRADLIKNMADCDLSKTQCQKSLFVDVSIIAQSDARTGIQRVVRAMLTELQNNPPAGYRVCPVFATSRQCYHHVPRDFSLTNSGLGAAVDGIEPIAAGPGDIFLGLDLATAILPAHYDQLASWKMHGTKIHILIYDLLPVLHPEWFHSRATHNFYRWLKTVAILADSLICISSTVKNELEWWLYHKYGISIECLPVQSIPMGCDIEGSAPSFGMPENASWLLDRFKMNPTALMVGTVEPRKGYAEIIEAFERNWKIGAKHQLVIVGKPGWKTRKLQNRIKNHKKFGLSLYWLENVSDEFLKSIYSSVYGVIIASHGEGYGLPIAEATNLANTLLVRNLPVFKELNNNSITWFESDTNDLSYEINRWFDKNEVILKPKAKPILWRDVCQILAMKIIEINNSKTNH